MKHVFKQTYYDLFKKHELQCSCGTNVEVKKNIDSLLLQEREEYLHTLMSTHLLQVLIFNKVYYGFRII